MDFVDYSCSFLKVSRVLAFFRSKTVPYVLFHSPVIL